MTGKDLRYSLVLKGLKPSELANHIGVSRSVISKWLSGKVKIPSKREDAITKFLGEVIDAEAKDRRRIEEIVSTMTEKEKINAIQFILGTLYEPDCEYAEHDGIGCLGYCGCAQDDEPIESCKRCEKYTGNVYEEAKWE